MDISPDPADSAGQKRKRSPSVEQVVQPANKAPKTTASHLQINYLARQYSDTLPLIEPDNDIQTLLALIAEYDGVLHRHESLAGNMGARPLGPILIQRFERLFDGPPRVLKTNAKDGPNIGWLDVVEFARNKPEQFNLEKSRDGIKVCQFYTKQTRVEISEDDYLLVKSGMPQKLIPPQPISDDEEKELGTLEILEKKLGQVVQAADQVSAKARQLNHRLKNRRAAIVSRRETEKESLSGAEHLARTNGDGLAAGGFVAVNSKTQNGPRDERGMVNGYTTSASAATREELLRNFANHHERQSSAELDRRASNGRPQLPAKGRSRFSNDQLDYAGFLNAAASPVAIPNTPLSLIPHMKASAAERFDDSGPYKADMMLRMEQLNRGDRVMPPCDRCRRLHMDCLKNLTACMGCTKKHAKCSWKDVEEQELREHPFVPRIVPEGKDKESGDEKKAEKKDEFRDSVGVRDEELLGESSDEELLPAKPHLATKSQSPVRTEGLESRDGARSAPATNAHPSPPTIDTSKTPVSSAPPSSISKKLDIPIYRPPTDSPVRTFTAHEWDNYTRISPTVQHKHSTPGSDIHDELRSAALEAEWKSASHDREEKELQEQERRREKEREREKKDGGSMSSSGIGKEKVNGKSGSTVQLNGGKSAENLATIKAKFPWLDGGNGGEVGKAKTKSVWVDGAGDDAVVGTVKASVEDSAGAVAEKETEKEKEKEMEKEGIVEAMEVEAQETGRPTPPPEKAVEMAKEEAEGGEEGKTEKQDLVASGEKEEGSVGVRAETVAA